MKIHNISPDNSLRIKQNNLSPHNLQKASAEQQSVINTANFSDSVSFGGHLKHIKIEQVLKEAKPKIKKIIGNKSIETPLAQKVDLKTPMIKVIVEEDGRSYEFPRTAKIAEAVLNTIKFSTHYEFGSKIQKNNPVKSKLPLQRKRIYYADKHEIVDTDIVQNSDYVIFSPGSKKAGF